MKNEENLIAIVAVALACAWCLQDAEGQKQSTERLLPKTQPGS
jgi:hypothetical protein